ncbi:MAG: hypothetical protein U0354_10535 [Candidatus Sericytochromatia bacterium]
MCGGMSSIGSSIGKIIHEKQAGKVTETEGKNQIVKEGKVTPELKEKLEELGKPEKISPEQMQKLKDILKKEPDLEKIKFFDHDLQDAKATLSDMMAGEGNMTVNHFKLDCLIDKMDKKELLAFAKHISNLMEKTDGKDEMLGRVLSRVLDAIGEHDHPHKPDDGMFIAKYNCSYSTRTLVI